MRTILIMMVLSLTTCVGGDQRDGQADNKEDISLADVPCPDLCAEVYNPVPACSRTVWDDESCECHLEPLPENAPCDDRNACTLEDRCVSGVCSGQLVDLTTFCDDGDPCTSENCDQYDGCVSTTRDGEACDDGNDCTLDEVCGDEGCHWQTQYVCGTCDMNAVGPDDSCELDYGDHDRCNGLLACTRGFCETDPNSVVDCRDPHMDPCMTSECEPSNGTCFTEPLTDDTRCIDRSPCTIGDTCQDGVCSGTPLLVPGCTCEADEDCVGFDDGDKCNGVFTCDHGLGVCRFSFESIVVCDTSADDACNATSCDPSDGLCKSTKVDDDTPCDDGDICTSDDVCSDGACTGVALDCSQFDGLCVHGACEAGVGCVVLPNQGGDCDPGLPCVTKGTCSSGVCVPSGLPCDDDDLCTTDACVIVGEGETAHPECEHQGPEKPVCSSAGVCVVGVPVVCNGGTYRCAYEDVPGYEPVELCDAQNLDNDCSGSADADDCVLSHGCGPGSVLDSAYASGTMQACAATDGDATCADGWHTCSYSQMLTGLEGVAPPSNYRIAASIIYDPVAGYSAEDQDDGACIPFGGICQFHHEVQAVSWDGVFGETVVYASEAWGCVGGQPSSDCDSYRFAGVLCCVDECAAPGQCDDGDPCTVDGCDGRGQCSYTPKVQPECLTGGVCVGRGVVCDPNIGQYVCDYADDELYDVVETTCDGLDNDCDGKTDAADPSMADAGPLCPKQAGVCLGARASSCVAGQWLACTDAIYDAHDPDYQAGTETLCDGLDNDCDGATDNVFAYQGAAVGQSCDGIGACGAGTVVCRPDGSGATCSTNPDASALTVAEDCDGVDNDCDGATDEPEDLDPSLAGCKSAGICAGGVPTTCVRGENPHWVCDYEAVSGWHLTERCDGVDDDCDGQIDEGFALGGQPVGTTCPDATCDGARVICRPDGSGTMCSFGGEAELAEICDGIDNDCNDETDEGIFYSEPDDDGGAFELLALGAECHGRGVCGPGTVVCGFSHNVTCSTLADGPDSQASAEVCNQLDDDCDGVPDEGLRYEGKELGQSCEGRGECGGGFVQCAASGQTTCSTNPDGVASQAHNETCNDKDDDCDGTIDDGVSVGPQDCAFKGVCTMQSGTFTCNDGHWLCDFSQAPFYQPTENRCDSRDNDCDGQTDEGFAGLGQPCDGNDADTCARGTKQCSADGLGLVCVGDVASPEICNGIDDDCDNQTDEVGATGCTPHYFDNDGDGYGSGAPQCRCGPGEQYVAQNGDCNDGNKDVYPERPELCDGIDNDCDGMKDQADAVDMLLDDPQICELNLGVCATTQKPVSRCNGTSKWGPCIGADYLAHDARYQVSEVSCDGADNDCDGATDAADSNIATVRPACASQAGVCQGAVTPVELCTANGWAACTNATYATHSIFFEPNQELSCDTRDNDCDGSVDEPFTFAGKSVGQSCDGTGACGTGIVQCRADRTGATCSTNPDGASSQAIAETCNNVDDDCDGATDDGLGVLQSTCRQVGQCNSNNVTAACSQGQWLCNYSQVPNYENGVEVTCDDKDNDCDGTIDEDFVATNGLHKGNPCGDGTCQGAMICNTQTPAPGDLVCSSSLATIPETCDGADNNCNGQTDEGLAWTPTGGQPIPLGGACNGIGECGNGTVVCSQGNATCSTNPDGTTPQTAPERCNNKDDDCDNVTDDGFGYQGLLMGKPCDGVGACGNGVVECASELAATCSTNFNGSQSQAVAETCDGQDNDCDGATDDGLGLVDSPCTLTGVCNANNVTAACNGTNGWSCNYSAVQFYHAGNELGFCDTRDNDCDGLTDEDFPQLGQSCDGNDADLCLNGRWSCGANGDVPVGTTPGQPFCAGDTNRTEVCDGADNDCDGQTDERDAANCQLYFHDGDGDGWGVHTDSRCLCAPDNVGKYNSQSLQSDCNDVDPFDHPGAVEHCDELDNDCDSFTDEQDAEECVDFFHDADHDGHGDKKGDSRCLCDPSPDTGYSGLFDDDCSDTDPTTYPTAPERCDSLDNDCDTVTDEGENTVDCTKFYKDNDNDLYGTAEYKCMCAPSGNYKSLVTGDCCDTDNKVSPAGTYSDVPATTCERVWDYNCNGIIDTQFTTMGRCSCPEPIDGVSVCTSCNFTEGWGGTGIPSCGVQRNWLFKCQNNNLQCQATFRTQKQGCK